MAVTADFYYTTDDPRVIGKTLHSVVSSVDCKVYEYTTLTEPKLLLNYNSAIFQANYCYLGAPFNRYYFMSPPATLPGGRMVVPLSVDVRQTFQDSIKKTEAFVLRAESDRDEMLVDDLIPARAGYVNQWIQLKTNDNGPLFPQGVTNPWNIVLEVIGE